MRLFQRPSTSRPAAGPVLGRLLAVLALAAAAGPATAASGTPEPAWTEQRSLLTSLRWWAEPAERERLQALAPQALPWDLAWAVPPGRDDGITAAEQSALLAAKRAALQPGGAAAADPAAGVRAEARITRAWRPSRALNVVLVALPGPGPAMVTQGGAAVDIALRDAADDRLLAEFRCSTYAGMARFAEAFGRIGHAEGALRDCAALFAGTLRAGDLQPAVPGRRAVVAPAGEDASAP